MTFSPIKSRELCDAATEGPWADGPPAWFRGRQNPEDGKRPIQRVGHPGTMANVYGKANAAFIAHARTALPRALDEIDRLTRERDEAVGLLAGMVKWFGKYPEFKPNPDYLEAVVETRDAARAFLSRHGGGE